MIAIVGSFGWLIVGLVVAAVERTLDRHRDVDGTTMTLLCMVGAIIGATIGRAFSFYVFGDPVGFLFAVAGAEALLQLYALRVPSPRTGRRDTRGYSDSTVAPTGEWTPRISEPVPQKTPLGILFLEAIGWAAVSGFAAAAAGLFALIIGERLYPQQYQQIPQELVLVPIGMVLGCFAAVIARLARPRWTTTGMFGFVIVCALVYAALMLQQTKSNARRAGLKLVFEPDTVTAVPCRSAGCQQTDPPLQWSVQGQLRLQETSGVGATIETIQLMSNEEGPPRGPAISLSEQHRFSGPIITLTGRQIAGARRLGPNETALYPVEYSYRTRSGDSRRFVDVYVSFSDRAGHKDVGVGLWKVR